MKKIFIIIAVTGMISCTKTDQLPTEVQEANANKSNMLISMQFVNGTLQRQYKYKNGFIINKQDENASYYYTYDVENLQTIMTMSVGSTSRFVHQFNAKGWLLYTDQYRGDLAYLRRVRFYENNTCTGWMNVPAPGIGYFKTRTDYIYTTHWDYYTLVTDYNSNGDPIGTGVDEIFKWITPTIMEQYTNKNVLLKREYFSSRIRRPDYNILNNPKPRPIETHESMSRLRYERLEPYPDSRPGLLVMKTEHFIGGKLSSIITVENIELNSFSLPTKYDLVTRLPNGQITGKSIYQFEYVAY